jgi:hypothetical protein
MIQNGTEKLSKPAEDLRKIAVYTAIWQRWVHIAWV